MDRSLNVTADLQSHIVHHADTLCEISALSDIRQTSSGKFQVKVNWLGFEDSEARYEPMSAICDTALSTVLAFLDDSSSPQPALREAARQTL